MILALYVNLSFQIWFYVSSVLGNIDRKFSGFKFRSHFRIQFFRSLIWTYSHTVRNIPRKLRMECIKLLLETVSQNCFQMLAI